MNHLKWAPVIVFAYNRPEHLRRTLQSLMGCTGFSQTPVVVFCDGPKNESDVSAIHAVQNVIRELLPSQSTRVVERKTNLGLAQSVIQGVSQVCAEYGRAIVIEDDMIVNPAFLLFMNHGLDYYEKEFKVFQVNGFVYDDLSFCKCDVVFLPFISSWGWATWHDRWQGFVDDLPKALARGQAVLSDPGQLQKFDLDGSFLFSETLTRRLAGELDVWAILWYLHVFSNQGLAVYPVQALLLNIGFDGSGTNIKKPSSPRMRWVGQNAVEPIWIFRKLGAGQARGQLENQQQVQFDANALNHLQRFFFKRRRLTNRIYRKMCTKFFEYSAFFNQKEVP